MAQRISNLPIGAKVKFGKHSINGETPWSIPWVIVDKNHGGTLPYPADSVSLAARYILDIRAFDNKEPSNPLTSRKNYGNNNYFYSNIDQWLNSDADEGKWYVAMHEYDAPPDVNAAQQTGYTHRPGFLKYFSTSEKNAMLYTDIQAIHYDGETRITIGGSRRVFLPTGAEMTATGEYTAGLGDITLHVSAYSTLEYAQQVKDYASSAISSLISDDVNRIWTRVANSSDATRVITYRNGAGSSSYADNSLRGVLPIVNLSNNTLVSDTTDAEGYYTFYENHKPSQPTTITVPTTIVGGKLNTISWSESVDADTGDSVSYVLSCQYDGNSANEHVIYSGTARSYSHMVDSSKTTVRYFIKAVDNYGEKSANTGSVTRTILNNVAPTISGTDSSLGTKTGEFDVTYTVGDAEGHPVTVTEEIDGVQIRSYVATLNATNTFSVTGGTWLKLQNGSHTLTIKATDSYDTTVRTYVFVKNVDALSIQNSTPLMASSMPTRIAISVTRNVPADATFKVEVCNNGFDTSPTWEDATNSVRSNLVYLFENKTKTATQWGVKVKVTLERNGSQGACYISAIGGNFE